LPALAELWRPAEHEALAGAGWDDERAEEAIRAIVADAETAFDVRRWPWHPRDGDLDEDRNDLYLGVAGMAWALHELGSTGWGDVVLGALERYRRVDEEPALAGGELTWHAGPLAKGSNLCHGTAGNAYAFLVLHRRSGDELWLDRARSFAMHAIGQVDRQPTRRPQSSHMTAYFFTPAGVTAI
jgi:Lanthionine synthetase C-like protein